MEAVILAVVVVGALWWWFNRRKLPKRSTTARRSGKSSNPNAVPPRLMRELDRLTRDRRVSERLIERVEFNHPGRSRRWCVEKAIYDIQRDRRS